MIEKDLKFMLFAMAWFCSAINNTNLVRNLQNQGIIRLEPVINAMIKVDR